MYTTTSTLLHTFIEKAEAMINKHRLLLLFTLTSILFLAATISFAVSAKTTNVPHPFFFTENKGQWDSRVLYKCNARNGMTWFLERDGITLLTMKEDRTKAPIVDPMDRDLPEMLRRHPARYPMKSHALKFHFVKATGNGQQATGELPWHNNYFLGNDSTKWAPNCRNYTNIVYRDVWDGIDIEWYEENGKLEFDFVVQPGADPSQIRMSCEGLIGEMARSSNELKLPTSLGELRTALPQVYQISSGGARNEVDAKFEITNKNEFGISLPNGYQKEHTLRIDPLIYSTFLGGSGDEGGYGICSDDNSGAIVTGTTTSGNFPTTTGAFDPTPNGNEECFVTHLSSDGSELLFSTFLGGADNDNAEGIVDDGSGGVFVIGETLSLLSFPHTHVFGLLGGVDCFVTHLNSAGSQIIYSDLLGGTNDDQTRAIVTASSGGVLITGLTNSTDFPTSNNAYDRTNNGSNDCFVTRLNSSGTAMIYSTYLGGSMEEWGIGIAADSMGGAFVTGWTNSTNFPTTINALSTSYNGGDYGDCFVTHLNGSGTQLLYSTYLGGTGSDNAEQIITADSGSVIVTGWTNSIDFPTTANAFDTSYNGGGFNGDGFITRLNSTGSQVIYSTFLGGSEDDDGWQILTDSNGGVIVVGNTSSSNFPTTSGAFCTTYNGGIRDGYVAHLNNTLSQLLYSTYLGGSGADGINGITRDGSGGFILVGGTSSADFPTTSGANETSYNGGSYDCFVTRLSLIADSTSIISERIPVPLEYTLIQNYPNPFNSSTTITYSLAKPGIAKLELFDLLGKKISTLINSPQNAGIHQVRFDGKNLSSGEYFYRLSAGDFQETKKLLLLK